MRLLEGAELAAAIAQAAAEEIARLGRAPKVVALHNPAEAAHRSYRRVQARQMARHGIAFDLRPFDPAEGPEPLLVALRALNADPEVTGIAIDQPLPAEWDAARVVAEVDPAKDIEATHPRNLGALVYGGVRPRPAAAAAAVELARAVHPSMRSLHAVVVGRSPMVGRPIALMLLALGPNAPTVTVCHTASRDVAAEARRADVLFVAAGRPELVRRDWVRPGATVIDVGIHAKDGRTVGDVAFDEVASVAGALSPVPGGVGPVAQAIVLQNIAACARRVAGH